MPDNSEVTLGLVDELLALPTAERQEELLRDAGVLNADGLDRLLEIAGRITRDDPGKAQRLATLCADVANSADAPAAVPRADYIRVQTHNENGEFDVALRLIKSAHNGYVALGMNLEALRTNVGLMVTLLEKGHYQEALDASRVVLYALEGKGELDVMPTRSQSDLLTALVQQNRGLCYEYMGRYDKALEAYEVSKERYRSLGMAESIGEIVDNQGLIFRQLGRSREALMAHEAAAATFGEAGLTLSHATSLTHVGEAHLQLGNYTSSLDAFERARRLLDSVHARVNRHVLSLDTANAYLALNLYSEALAAYQEADGLLEVTAIAHDRARALWGAGFVLIARSEFEEAGKSLDEAATLFAAADNMPLLSGVMLEQASLLAARGDREGALAASRRSLALVSEDSWPVQQFYSRLRLADLLLPDVTLAEPHLLAARRLADRLALPQLRYRLDERLGHLRRLQGRDEEARTLLEAAVEEIERLRGTVAQDAVRSSFLRDKTAAYEDLLQLYLARDDEVDIRRAFTVAERAKSRALVDLISGVAEKETSADPELERQLRRLQADLNAIYSGLLGGSDEGERAPLPDLHARAAELEGEISRLRLQAAAAGSQSELFATPMPLGAIRSGLPPDVTLLAYHATGDEIMAFVYARGRIRVARRLGTVTVVERLLRKLAAQWDRLGAGQSFVGRHMALLERSTRQVLGALYSELVAPLEPLLEEVAASNLGAPGVVPKLAVVPHGPLHQVPFHALFDGERYLLERFEISYAPSATVYALCQERAMRDLKEALVVGVEDPLIPAVADEARAVAEHFLKAEVRVGEEATVAALRDEAPGRGTLHLACHGMFRSDNPMFSALKLHDGWLTAADAMSLDLKGALVTLSACESGRHEVVGGDEILGLARAFLGAGAATLVVSLWLVRDETTAELMGNWYERLQNGEGRAEALRAAQLDIRERYPHPYYWAPFVLIGKR